MVNPNNSPTDLSDSLINAANGPVQYRFSGYQLPKIQLDSTGPQYDIVSPHPYYYDQPDYWTKPAYQGGHLIESNPLLVSEQQGNSGTPPVTDPTISQENTISLYRLSNFS